MFIDCLLRNQVYFLHCYNQINNNSVIHLFIHSIVLFCWHNWNLFIFSCNYYYLIYFKKHRSYSDFFIFYFWSTFCREVYIYIYLYVAITLLYYILFYNYKWNQNLLSSVNICDRMFSKLSSVISVCFDHDIVLSIFFVFCCCLYLN